MPNWNIRSTNISFPGNDSSKVRNVQSYHLVGTDFVNHEDSCQTTFLGMCCPYVAHIPTQVSNGQIIPWWISITGAPPVVVRVICGWLWIPPHFVCASWGSQTIAEWMASLIVTNTKKEENHQSRVSRSSMSKRNTIEVKTWLPWIMTTLGTERNDWYYLSPPVESLRFWTGVASVLVTFKIECHTRSNRTYFILCTVCLLYRKYRTIVYTMYIYWMHIMQYDNVQINKGI